MKKLQAALEEKTKRIVFFAGIGAILAFLFIYFVGFQATFLFSEQLRITTSPVDFQATVTHGEPLLLNYDTQIDTHFSCTPLCTTTLLDLTTGNTIFSEHYEDAANIADTHELVINEEVGGVKLYSYQVVCRNKRTNLCKSDNSTQMKTALATINHEPTAQQKANILFLQEQITTTKQDLAEKILTINRYQLNVSFPQDTNLELTLREEIRQVIKAIEILEAEFKEANIQQVQEEVDLLPVTNIQVGFDQFVANQENTLSIHNRTAKATSLYNAKQRDIAIAKTLTTAYDQLEIIEALTAYPTVEELTLVEGLLNNVSTYVSTQENQTKTQLQEQLTNVEEAITTPELSCETKEQIQATIVEHNSAVAQMNNSENLTRHEEALVENIELNYTGSNPEFVNKTTSEFAANLSVNIDLSSYDLFCNTTGEAITEIEVLNLPPAQNITVPQVHLPNNQCCYDNQCQACAVNESKRPVLLLHGHAFVESHSAQASISAFGKLQRELDYINAGQITVTSDLEAIDNYSWGKFPRPISLRGSYYLVSYYDLGQQVMTTQKKESIESYAIRLKELIDVVKARTGAQQVDIVAHSMGGLVARQYISLFGEENVGYLIMIGTPNHGVTGTVDQFCAVTGAKKECEEMQAGSIFLRRLNDQRNQPQSTQYITIAGSGCDMQGNDGDGVSTISSVQLDFATNYIINGTCTDFLQTSLHGDLLNPDKYPRVVEIIQEELLQ
jgi:uncharacterized alpha/beta hydrolase family protein